MSANDQQPLTVAEVEAAVAPVHSFWRTSLGVTTRTLEALQAIVDNNTTENGGFPTARQSRLDKYTEEERQRAAHVLGRLRAERGLEP